MAKAMDFRGDVHLNEVDSLWIGAPTEGLVALVEGMFLHCKEMRGVLGLVGISLRAV
jgi:hypothetical protein